MRWEDFIVNDLWLECATPDPVVSLGRNVPHFSPVDGLDWSSAGYSSDVSPLTAAHFADDAAAERGGFASHPSPQYCPTVTPI